MGKYSVKLTVKQRDQLETMCRKGEAPAQRIRRAQILLKTDSGEQGPRWSMPKIQEALGVSRSFIKNVRKGFAQEGLEATIERKPQPERPEKKKINGEQEAQMIAVLCTQKPEGQERWTMRLLRDRLIELEIVESVSHETVRMVLKKTNSNHGKRSSGALDRQEMTAGMSTIWKMSCSSMCTPTMLRSHECV